MTKGGGIKLDTSTDPSAGVFFLTTVSCRRQAYLPMAFGTRRAGESMHDDPIHMATPLDLVGGDIIEACIIIIITNILVQLYFCYCTQ